MNLNGNAFKPINFWSWNGLMEEEEVRWQIKEFKNKGFGGFFIHSRAGRLISYMGEQWMKACGYAIDEAEKQGLDVWLYDEDGWPSGFAGGLVNGCGKEFWAKTLSFESEIKKKLLDKERYSYLKAEAYRDFKQGILSGEEYHIVKEKYTQNIMELDQKLEEMQMEKEEIEAISNAENKWMQAFLKFRNENNLTREMAESLLEKVEIYGDMRVHIVFKFQNEYECLRSWTNGGEMKGDVRKAISG